MRLKLNQTFSVAVIILVGLISGLNEPALSGELNVELRASENANAPVTESVKLYSASYALIIGNDAYSGAWPRLSNAIRDAELIAETMRDKGFDVTLKTDLKSVELIEALETFFYKTGGDPGARLFLWYAGHGYSEAGEGYLVPVDAPDPSEGWKFLRKALSLRRMGEYVRGAKALHVLSVFDSCFAGTVFNVGRAKPPPAITRATTRPVRQFLTSGDAGQVVSDDGTFRKLFIRAVNGESRADANQDGYLAASELGLFMTSQITNYTNGNQTPRNGKLSDPDWDLGDFVFQVTANTSTRKAAPAIKSVAAPSNGQSAEILFWRSIKDSEDAASYQAYLDTYPTGAFAALARVRLQAGKRVRTALLAPRILLEPVESTFIALQNVNVRIAPDAGAAKVASLRKGSEVYVPGKVTAKDWFAVSQNGKRLGYVYSKLLQDKETFIADQTVENERRAKVARLAHDRESRRRAHSLKQAEADKERLDYQRRVAAAAALIEQENRKQKAADLRYLQSAKQRKDKAQHAERGRLNAGSKKTKLQAVATLTPTLPPTLGDCTSPSLTAGSETIIDLQNDCEAIKRAIIKYYNDGGYYNDVISNFGMKIEDFYILEALSLVGNIVTLDAKYLVVANIDSEEIDFESKFTLIKQGGRYKVTEMSD